MELDYNKYVIRNKEFYSNFIGYKADDPRVVGWESTMSAHRRYKKCLELSKVRDGDSIIDVGCGTGIFYKYLSEHLDHFDYLGIDVIDVYVESAKKLYPDANFMIGNFLKMPVENKFDVLFAIGSFYTNGVKFIDEQYEYLYSCVKKARKISDRGVITLVVSDEQVDNYYSDGVLFSKYNIYLPDTVYDVFDKLGLNWYYVNFEDEWIIKYII